MLDDITNLEMELAYFGGNFTIKHCEYFIWATDRPAHLLLLYYWVKHYSTEITLGELAKVKSQIDFKIDQLDKHNPSQFLA